MTHLDAGGGIPKDEERCQGEGGRRSVKNVISGGQKFLYEKEKLNQRYPSHGNMVFFKRWAVYGIFVFQK